MKITVTLNIEADGPKCLPSCPYWEKPWDWKPCGLFPFSKRYYGEDGTTRSPACLLASGDYTAEMQQLYQD